MNAETTVEIRRYPNRRLYDRGRRQYVTLQDIETLVLEGTNVVVRDSRTGEDLTRQVLTQILMERHPQKMDLFPVAMLHSILRANALALELWRGYMTQALAAMDSLKKAATPFASPLGWMSAFFPTFSPPTPVAPEPAPVPDPGPDAEAEVATVSLEGLVARLERLEAAAEIGSPSRTRGTSLDGIGERLGRLEAGPARPATKPRPRFRAKGGAA
jgi:polyhydroxyalkanoate synthesis repressor PhaR